MSTVKKTNIQELSQSERILLAEELWDSVAENQNELEVTDSHRKLLDEIEKKTNIQRNFIVPKYKVEKDW